MLPQQYYNQGTAGVSLLTATVANPLAGKLPLAPGLNGATIARNLLLLPFPEFGSVTEQYSSIGSAPYNALQIQIAKPMKNHFSIQGNFTWDKLMLRQGFLDDYQRAGGHLYSVQDSAPTMFGNIFGTYQFPKFTNRPFYERIITGGWQLNSVARFSNGPLIGAPGNVDIIGNTRQVSQSYTRAFNTCYQNTAGQNVSTVIGSSGLPTLTGCDSLSQTPAFRQRLAFTSQSNSTVLNIRQTIHPLLDASLFKQFIIREGASFEIRGEFFNILNTPNFGGPSTSVGAANFGSVASTSGLLTQANDPRIGQLTARINF